MTTPLEQSQFELFPGANRETVAGSRSMAFTLRDLTISLENIIVLCIIFIMAVVLFFSLGVERGKRLNFLPQMPTAEAVDSTPQKLQAVAPEKAAAGKSQAAVSEELIMNVGTETPTQETIPLPEDIKEAIDKQYTIQVASFKQQKFANEEASSLKKKGFDSFVVSKGSHAIVCVGKFGAMDQAKQFSNRLKTKYKDCLVRRL